MVCAGFQRHCDQAQPHVDHHVGVVSVQGVSERDEEAEQLAYTWQAIWNQRACNMNSSFIRHRKSLSVVLQKKNRIKGLVPEQRILDFYTK